MITRLRFTATTALALSMLGAVSFGQHYNQTNLVSSEPGVAPVTDPTLINAWGMSRATGSPWWVSDNGKGLALLYNGAGSKQGLIVTIPAAASGKQGTPTGTIFNGSSTDFLLAPGAPALFLFATLDGTIAGWNPAVGLTSGMMPPSTHAVIAAKGASGSVYTGLTSSRILANRYLYAANFGKGSVDVYDSSFHPVHFTVGPDGQEPFTDDRLPPDFVPFNVQAIGNDIVVTYALHEPGSPVETDGPGLGYVDIYSSMGRLELRLDHGDWLNAPWGVVLAPLDFGAFSHQLLIGQFAGGGTTQSSGWVVAYSLATGHYQGRLVDTAGAPLSINGIWALSTGNAGAGATNYDAAGSPASEVYFNAGPKQSSEGLFGYLTPIPKELIQGNNQ